MIGVGDLLFATIPKWLKRPGCGCKRYARKMNRWGVKQCEERFDEIVCHLVSKKPYRVETHLATLQARRWTRSAIREYYRMYPLSPSYTPHEKKRTDGPQTTSDDQRRCRSGGRSLARL